MNHNNETPDSIQDINLSYLMLAQRLLHDDREAGMFRLGLSAPLAELLSTLTLAQTTRLATSCCAASGSAVTRCIE
ncbi:hypothetical protein WI80_05755 [Burkholderia ubonensis]|nr:hypothetical protein WI80_05755 [Burkholderia ubonensis]KVU11878.1 hypothetical protein WK63_20725 [Burkholderia ubonensis]